MNILKAQWCILKDQWFQDGCLLLWRWLVLCACVSCEHTLMVFVTCTKRHICLEIKEDLSYLWDINLSVMIYLVEVEFKQILGKWYAKNTATMLRLRIVRWARLSCEQNQSRHFYASWMNKFHRPTRREGEHSPLELHTLSSPG